MRWSTFAVLVFLCARAAALDPAKALTSFMHENWQSEQGLPQNSVTTVLQTRDGYLWLGTQEGLVRFDGVRFVVFDTRNTPQLGHNFVLTLYEDRRGRLWIGTYGGLIRHESDRFTRFTTKDGLPSDQVRALLEDPRGRLWVGTLGGGLAVYDGTRFAIDPVAATLPGKRVRALARDRSEAMWIATDAGLARLDANGLRNFTTNDGLTHDDIRALWIVNDVVWIGTDGGGLNRFANGTFSAITTRDGLANDIVRALYGDRDGNVWIGTWGGGVQRLHNNTLGTLRAADGLTSDLIWTFHEDRERSLWIGTDGGGLSRLKEGKLQALTTREGLTNDIVLSVLEDRDGALWIGTYGGGLNRWKDGAVTSWTTRSGLANDSVQALHQSPDGTLWIGTSGGGLNRLANGKLTAITTRDGLTSDFVRAVLTDRSGTVWIGTDGGGLNRLRDGAVSAVTTAEGLSNDIVLTLLESGDGSLWIGTEGGGLNRLRNGKLTAITPRDGLSHDIVSALHEDRDGTLWIGTSGGGLNRLQNGKITAITTQQGLFDDTIFTIVDDGAGHFWMTCNKGIFKVAHRDLDEVLDGRRKSLVSVWYGVADGMRSAECAAGSPAGLRTRGGVLWFPTIRGAVIADPPRMKINQLVPPVILENITIDNRPANARLPLRVPPRTLRLDFQYTALSFRAPERVHFKYKLEGFDDEWIDAGARRTAYYTNVPHGDYRFRVIAANEDGVWNESGAAVAVTVEPRLTERTSFRVLLGLLLLCAAYAIYRFRVWQVRARAIEEASLTDPLTGLRNRRYLTQHIAEDASTAIANDRDLVFFLVDVDHFKSVNDQYGHHAGDLVLVELAKRLANIARESDYLVRWGGEEFLLVARGLARADASGMAARICAVVAASPFEVADGVLIRRTCSVGFATLPFLQSDPRALSWSEIAELADAALYGAKRSGRNGWVGLYATERASPDGLYARMRTSLATTTAAGEILVSSSFAHVLIGENAIVH